MRPAVAPAGAPRFEFVGGKGGVGKTTLAAALGLATARAGQRTLVVSTDPAHSLGDALGRRLGSRILAVPAPGRPLHALELDAERALARWLSARRRPLRLIAERGTYLDREDIERFLDLTFPGVDELGGLLELARLAASGAYQVIAVDTAPTGHALRLLAVPTVLRRMAAALGQMLAKHHFLISRLTGRDRRDLADGLVAELEAEADRLARLLADQRQCRFRWVVLPEALAVEEARDAVQALEARGIQVQEIVVNRVTPPGAADALGRRRRAAEQEAIAAVRQAFPGRALRLIPDLGPEPRGAAGLEPLVTRLAGRARVAPRTARAAGRRPRPATGPAARGSRDGARGLPKPTGSAAEPAVVPALAPAGVRLLLVAGKGGVGKTTWAVAAALALGHAAPRRRILLLSTDPAHSVGDVLGLTMGDAERRVAEGPTGLRIRELDAERAFESRRERYRAAVDALFDAVRGQSRLDVAFDRAVARDLLDLAPGGLDELGALLTLIEALFPPAGPAPASGAPPRRPDLVMVDTAPTGHLLRLLALPGVALAWVRTLLATLLKYRQVLGLGPVAADLVDLARGLRQLQDLLGSAQTRVVVVTRPAVLPRLETRRLLARLERLGLRVSAVVVNAVRATAPGGPRVRTPRGRRPAAEARGAGAPGPEVEEQAEVARLRTAVGARPARPELWLAPLVAPPPRGVPSLEAWAATWTRVAS